MLLVQRRDPFLHKVVVEGSQHLGPFAVAAASLGVWSLQQEQTSRLCLCQQQSPKTALMQKFGGISSLA